MENESVQNFSFPATALLLRLHTEGWTNTEGHYEGHMDKSHTRIMLESRCERIAVINKTRVELLFRRSLLLIETYAEFASSVLNETGLSFIKKFGSSVFTLLFRRNRGPASLLPPKKVLLYVV